MSFCELNFANKKFFFCFSFDCSMEEETATCFVDNFPFTIMSFVNAHARNMLKTMAVFILLHKVCSHDVTIQYSVGYQYT